MSQALILAAHHEAGHAVAAIYSRFHNLPGELVASANGHGENFAGLSGRKCSAAGKEPNPRDKEIASDLALIACAGFEAEVRCTGEIGGSADVHAAKADYDLAKQVLGNASLKHAKRGAALLIEQRWPEVRQVASALLSSPNYRISGAHAYDVLGVQIP
jgi:hypothetical protein